MLLLRAIITKAMPFRFVSKANAYLLMNHLYYYKPIDPHANLVVRARDPYGNVYEADTTAIVREPFKNFAHYYKWKVKSEKWKMKSEEGRGKCEKSDERKVKNEASRVNNLIGPL